ncbi:hypothetical protein MKZ17_13515 [Solibacillus sp. FSL R7-0682]|uniref:hypothetical protein n=1 Tax=Solibacillus sp. FSL R7-0682 TaxID=2921690 RepID=UPI0030F4F3F7
MHEEQFKAIARKPLTEKTKAKKLNEITARLEKVKRKNRYGYITVLILFTCVFFVFLQTLKAPTEINELTGSEIKDLGNLKEATILLNHTPEKMYNITSIFYTNRAATTEVQYLEKLESLFQTAQTKPFEGNLKDYNDSYDLFLEFENGEKRYIKVLSGNYSFVVLDMKLQRSFQLEKGNIGNAIVDVYNDVRSQDKWLSWHSILGLIGLMLFIIYEIIESRKRKVKEKEKSITAQKVGIITGIFFVIQMYFMERIFGSYHIGFVFFTLNLNIIVNEYLDDLNGIKKVNWPRFIKNTIIYNLLLFMIFV